jgi:putative hydrolase of the HAD superfamily
MVRCDMPVDLVGLDGDDTLWHSERLFFDAHDRVAELLTPFVERTSWDARVREVQDGNFGLFGYGVKGFVLSLVETAVEVSDGAIPAVAIRDILELGKEMLRHPVELLPGVEEAVRDLAGSHRLVLVTKGDLVHQESKVARSGLADLFERVHIVVEKDTATYRRVLGELGAAPERFVMAGNSVRSDVLPVLALGGHAALLPYPFVAAHEQVDDADAERDGFHELGSIAELPALVASL